MGKDGRQWKSRWDQWGRYWGLAGLLTWRYQRSELKDRKRWSEMGMLKADTKSCILMMTRSRACSERKAKLGWRTRSLGAEGTSAGVQWSYFLFAVFYQINALVSWGILDLGRDCPSQEYSKSLGRTNNLPLNVPWHANQGTQSPSLSFSPPLAVQNTVPCPTSPQHLALDN